MFFSGNLYKVYQEINIHNKIEPKKPPEHPLKL